MQKLSKRDIRRLVRVLLQEYDKAITRAVEKLCVVNSTGNQQETIENWWARGDLNPGPPPRQGGVLTRLDDGPPRSTVGNYIVSSGLKLLDTDSKYFFGLGRFGLLYKVVGAELRWEVDVH